MVITITVNTDMSGCVVLLLYKGAEVRHFQVNYNK